jgi:uncharacterized membrane protein
MEPNVAAGLSYLSMFFLGPIVPIVFFFIEKSNRFLKFHAAQGILISIAGFVFGIGLIIVSAILTALAIASQSGAFIGLVFGLLSLIEIVVGLGVAGLVIWAIVAAFSNQYLKLPVIGNIAEKWVGGPAVPLF